MSNSKALPLPSCLLSVLWNIAVFSSSRDFEESQDIAMDSDDWSRHYSHRILVTLTKSKIVQRSQSLLIRLRKLGNESVEVWDQRFVSNKVL